MEREREREREGARDVPRASEIRFYAARGMPAYAYGPGLLAISHGPNECVHMNGSSTAPPLTKNGGNYAQRDLTVSKARLTCASSLQRSCSCLCLSGARGEAVRYFRVGSSADASTATKVGTVLMGGDDVDAAFQVDVRPQRSRRSPWSLLPLPGPTPTTCTSRALCPAENSVATSIIPNRAMASDPFVVSTILNAEALWIAGGIESNHINDWKGTPVQDAVNTLIARGVPVGGTSAGMNVLTQFVVLGARQSGRHVQPGARIPVHQVHHARLRLRRAFRRSAASSATRTS